MDVQSTANAVSMSVLLLLTIAIIGGIIYFRFWPNSLRRPPPPAAAPVVGAAPSPAPAPVATPPTPPASTTPVSTSVGESGWKKAWRSIRQVMRVVVVVGLVLLLVIFSANSNWDPTNPPTLLVAVVLLVLIALWPIKSWKQLLVAVIVMAVIVFFLPSIPGRLEGLYRGFNYGDWSEPVDYVRTIQNGTVTMRPGVVENFYVVGEVTLINPNPYTCLGVGPENTFWIVPARFASGEENPRRNVIRPKSGEKEMAFVRVKPAFECSNR